MKKIKGAIMLSLLLFLVMFGLCACGPIPGKNAEPKVETSGRFQVVGTENLDDDTAYMMPAYRTEYLADTETGALYAFFVGVDRTAIVSLLNADGTPILYDGEAVLETSGRFTTVGSEVLDDNTQSRVVAREGTYLLDTETNVLYLCLHGYERLTIAPLLNADGTPQLYEGKIVKNED